VPDVEDHPTDDDIAVVDDALDAFTMAAGHGTPRPLAVFARRGGSIVAGIHGWTWGGCCELVTLWVSEPMRGRGLGRDLLTAAEDRARARGCHQVVLFTHAFQTPDLYIGSGYDVVGEVDDYPAGSAAYWLRKRLDTPPRATNRRIGHATLGLGMAVLLVAEAVDAIRVLRRRVARMAADWWAGVERRERRNARRAEIIALAVPIIRDMTHPAPGSGRLTVPDVDRRSTWPRCGWIRPGPRSARWCSSTRRRRP
jgi:ribosomal protein S18 acetylase RimI-like enzyme